MKQQFLDLTGLTELVAYIKSNVTDKKEILPYASNKLFPSTGDINAIYIDTATNTIYRWDTSSKTYIILAKAVKSVSISESTENGKITLTVDGVKTTVPIHGLGSAAYTNSNAYSPADHTHTKAQIGLGSVDNTADKDKSVKHANTADSATTAGTATSVPWSGVTGKPSSYPPASHNHDERYYTETEMNSKLAEKAPKVHTHVKSEVGLGNVDNTSDANKSVKYAASAGTATKANAVPWSGVTGKPSTYTPSAHTHKMTDISDWGSYIYDVHASRTANTVLAAPSGSNGSATFRKLVATDIPSITKSKISDFPSSLPASDVYAWAKASTKPSYSWNEITGKPSTYTPSSHTHNYLPLSGGTMSGTAMITWPDSGNWSNSNKNVTFPVIRGGLSWLGQSDGIQLYAVETQNDNLELYLKFIDDNSNGLSIINSTNTQTARISATGEITASKFVGNLAGTASSASAVPWSGITGKPSTFTPASHSHNKVSGAYTGNGGQQKPNYFGTNQVGFLMMNTAVNNNTHYKDWIIMDCYSGTDVGGAVAFGVNRQSLGAYIMRSESGRTSWSESAELLHTANYNSYAPTKTGGGASGTWGINVSGGAAYPTGFHSRATSATWGNQTGTFITDWHTSNGGDIQFRDNSGQLNVIIDGFFYQNEGRNLVLDSVNYTSYAATKGHTHNYAGSSSAGGNANAAVKLATARSINGTNFDGSGNITTANWGTARTITVGNTGKSVNGSGNVSWSLGEIGVHVSNKEPAASDGKNGDVWIVYEG